MNLLIKKGCLSTSLFVSLVSIRQPEQPGHLASKAEQQLEPEQQQDSELAEPLAVAEPSVVASADLPERAVAAKQEERIAFAASRAVGLTSAVLRRRGLGAAARVAKLGAVAIAVQQGQEQQPGQQRPGAWERWQQGNQRQPAHRLVR